MPARHPVTLDGITRPLMHWLARIGIRHNAYAYRRRKGWTERQALLTPRGGDREAVAARTAQETP